MMDEKVLASALEKMPEEGDVTFDGGGMDALQNFLDYSLEQIEAMIDLVRGDLDRCGGRVGVADKSYTIDECRRFTEPCHRLQLGEVVIMRML